MNEKYYRLNALERFVENYENAQDAGNEMNNENFASENFQWKSNVGGALRVSLLGHRWMNA